MSTPSKEPWLKYPQIVYNSVQIDTKFLRQCSDLATDFELCKNNYNFMEEQEIEYKNKPKYNLPEKNFEISSITNGTRFFKAKKIGACNFLKNQLNHCIGSVKEERYFVEKLYRSDPKKFTDLKIAEV